MSYILTITLEFSRKRRQNIVHSCGCVHSVILFFLEHDLIALFIIFLCNLSVDLMEIP